MRSTRRQPLITGLIAAVTAILPLPLLVMAAPLAAAVVVPLPDCAGQDTSTLEGVAGHATPVVVVHGWTGAAMWDTRWALEQKLTAPNWQHFLFDYHHASTQWADSPGVAGCLSEYLLALSDQHRFVGGDGMVYVVAHSMGGLATRFAADDVVDGTDGPTRVSDRLGGLVTLDTPHAGSPWGNTDWTMPAEWVSALGRVIPDGTAAARRCLVTHTAGQGLPDGCTAAPYLPPTVPIHQVAGVGAIERTFFGWHAYTIPLAGDGIVPLESQQGYIGSAGQLPERANVSLSVSTCSVRDSAVLAEAAARSRNLYVALAGAFVQLKADELTLGNTLAGTVDRHSVVLLAAALAMPCSHMGIGTDDTALTQTAQALQEMVADGGAGGAPAPPDPQPGPDLDLPPGPVLDLNDDSGAFYSPSGNIVCAIDPSWARCDIFDKTWEPPTPPDCDLDWGSSLWVGSAGAATTGCVGDTIAYVEPGSSSAWWWDADLHTTAEHPHLGTMAALNYGSSIVSGDLWCHVAQNGVTCENRNTRAGFFISRDRYELH